MVLYVWHVGITVIIACCVCVWEVLRTGNPQCLFYSNLGSSFRNIYKGLKYSAYQIEQMWEFTLRWKSPGICLKPPNTHTLTDTLHLHSLESPQSLPLHNNRAVMSLYCIQINRSFYQLLISFFL